MSERVFAWIKIVAGGAVLATVVSAPAQAYVDPGSGTLLVQLLIAAAVGVTFYFRRALFNIKSFFGGNRKDQDRQQDAERDTAAKD